MDFQIKSENDRQRETCSVEPEALVLGEQPPFLQLTEEALERVGHVVHLVLAVPQAQTAGVTMEAVVQRGHAGIHAALAVDALGGHA